jgi:hypothetical protein
LARDGITQELIGGKHQPLYGVGGPDMEPAVDFVDGNPAKFTLNRKNKHFQQLAWSGKTVLA